MRIFFIIINIALSTLLNAASASEPAKPTPAIVQAKELTHVEDLVNKPYKLAAHYLPPIVMRGLLYNEVPFKANDFHLSRKIYQLPKAISSNTDPHKLSSPDTSKLELIEDLDMDFKVSWSGFLGRKIIGTGKLNELDVSFINKTKFRILGKRAEMHSELFIDGKNIFSVDANMKAKDKSIKVTGTMLEKEIDYSTEYRTTEGTLASSPFKLYVEGIRTQKDEVIAVVTDGNYAGAVIKGYANRPGKKYFSGKEFYGSWYIETKLSVED